MISIFIFLSGLGVGWFFSSRRQEHLKRQEEKRIFSEEIELRATPDTYLSEFDLIRKRYYEAKFQ